MSFLFSWIFFFLFCVLKSTHRSAHVQHLQCCIIFSMVLHVLKHCTSITVSSSSENSLQWEYQKPEQKLVLRHWFLCFIFLTSWFCSSIYSSSLLLCWKEDVTARERFKIFVWNEAESQHYKDWKKKKGKWGGGGENKYRKKNLYVPSHLFITRPIFHIKKL